MSDLDKLTSRGYSVEEVFILIYVIIDDFLKANFNSSNCLRLSNGPAPKFTDAEVITLHLVGEILSFDSHNAWYHFVKNNWLYLFPHLPDRTRLGRRLKFLYPLLGKLFKNLCSLTDANDERYFLVDSFPLALCHLQRYSGSTLPFEYHASVGFCSAKKSHYYGMKIHLTTDLRGIPRFLILTPAHVSDIDTLKMMAPEIHHCNGSGFTPIVIGDKGYAGKKVALNLQQNHGIILSPVQRNYLKQEEESALNDLLNKSRKIIETTIAILVDQFNMSKTRTRSIVGLCASLLTKCISVVCCCLINIINKQPPLHIKNIAF
jgi:hypothetical protein